MTTISLLTCKTSTKHQLQKQPSKPMTTHNHQSNVMTLMQQEDNMPNNTNRNANAMKIDSNLSQWQ